MAPQPRITACKCPGAFAWTASREHGTGQKIELPFPLQRAQYLQPVQTPAVSFPRRGATHHSCKDKAGARRSLLAAWPHRTLHRGHGGGAGSASIVPLLAAGSEGRLLPACAWAAAAWQPDTGTCAPPLLLARAVSSHLAASLSVRRAEGPENTRVIQVHLLVSHLRWRRSWSDVAAVVSSSVHSLWSLHIAATRPPGDTPKGLCHLAGPPNGQRRAKGTLQAGAYKQEVTTKNEALNAVVPGQSNLGVGAGFFQKHQVCHCSLSNLSVSP